MQRETGFSQKCTDARTHTSDETLNPLATFANKTLKTFFNPLLKALFLDHRVSRYTRPIAKGASESTYIYVEQRAQRKYKILGGEIILFMKEARADFRGTPGGINRECGALLRKWGFFVVEWGFSLEDE